MKLVKQMYNCDCGTACVAMLAGVSYNVAMKAVSSSYEAEHGKKYRADKSGTNTAVVKMALIKLGVYVTRQGKATSFTDIPAGSLVSVKHPKRNLTHWVVWTGKRVYCPTEGSRGRTRYNWIPRSYFKVLATHF